MVDMRRRRRFYGGRRSGRYRKAGYFGRFKGPMAEKKYKDTTLALTTIANTGTSLQNATTNITEILNGTGESERTGHRVRVMSLQANMLLVLPAGTTANDSDEVRIIIVVDKQANGALATLTHILETVGYQAFRNIENGNRFVWLYNKTFSMNPPAMGTATSSSERFKHLKVFFKLAMPMYFDGLLGETGEVRSHQILAFAITRDGRVQMQVQWRIRFYG